jgi:hypothetical protein
MKKMLIALLTAASLHATAQTEGNKTLLPLNHGVGSSNFRKPKTGEKGEHLSSSVVMQIVGAQNMKDVSAVKLGRAFTAMGFDYKIIDGIRRYHVVRRQPDEVKLHREQPDLGADGSGEVW